MIRGSFNTSAPRERSSGTLALELSSASGLGAAARGLGAAAPGSAGGELAQAGLARFGRVLVGAFCLLAGLGVLSYSKSAAAQSDDKIERLAKQLKSGEDFRVRTQAALALGASADARAVRPLCSGLADKNNSVRAGAAAALGKLRLGGLDCLNERQPKEKTKSVKSAITKASKQLLKSLGPDLDDSTQYYVLLELKNKSELSDKLVDARVRSGLVQAFAKQAGFALAPPSETSDEAKSRLEKHKKAAGFYLTGNAQLTHQGGVLRARIDISVFTYPNRSLKGGYNVSVGFADIAADDEASKKELLKEVGRSAAEKLIENAARFKD